MTERPAPFIGAMRVQWLRPMAQALRVLGLLVGLLAAYDIGFTGTDVAIAVFLGLFILWRALPWSAGVVRMADLFAAEAVATGLIVLATGGWSSPWLLAHIVPLGLAALGVAQRRAIAVGVAAVASASLGTIGAWPAASDVAARASSLMLVVVFSVIARTILVDAGGESEDALGEVSTLWNVRALLAGLHSQVAGTRTRFNVGEALDALRAASPVLSASDVLGLLVLQDDGRLRTVHAVGLPTMKFRMRDLPERVREPRRDGLPVAVSLSTGGLVADTTQGAYMWLPVPSDEAPHVLFVEAIDDLVDGVLPALAKVAEPLAITVSNASWFARVRHLGVDEERQRIAAQLHDRFAQSLAVVQLELELAQRRHPDDTGLAELRAHVRDSLEQLRDTMVELRATVDDEHPLDGVLRSLTTRLTDRHGVLAELTVEGDGERPVPAMGQQLLRITQELTRRAVEERGASAVYIRYVCDAVELRLEVTDDGQAPVGATLESAVDVIRDRAEAIGARVETGHAGPGLSRVSVSALRSSRTAGARP